MLTDLEQPEVEGSWKDDIDGPHKLEEALDGPQELEEAIDGPQKLEEAIDGPQELEKAMLKKLLKPQNLNKRDG